MAKKKVIKKRARGENKKAQFDEMLDEAMKLFVKRGPYGFGMRALARRLNMSEANLYNYVKSKRELWIAVRKKHYQEYQDGLNDLVKNHKGDFIDFCIKWAEYYLDFASSNFKRFQMMNFVPAPPSDKIGKLEESYQPFEFIKQGIQIVQNAVDRDEIKKINVVSLFYYVYSLCLGAAKAEADLRIRQKVLEPILFNSADFDSTKFRTYILNELKDRLERLRVED